MEMLAYYTIGALILAFVLGTLLKINIGLLAVGLGYIALLLCGSTGVEIIDALSDDNIIMFVGVNLLFTAAYKNGFFTIFCEKLLRLAGGRRWIMPIVFSLVGFIVGTMGAGGVPAVALLASPGMTMCKKAKIPPFLMAAMVNHGIFAGTFSPLSTYAIPIYGFLTKNGIDISGRVWLWTMIFELAAAIILFFVFGGISMFKEDKTKDKGERLEAVLSKEPGSAKFTLAHWVTIASLIVLIVLVLIFGYKIGLVAIVLGLIITVFSAREGTTEAQIIGGMPWGMICLIIGTMALVQIMQDAGGVTLVVDAIMSLNIGIIGLLLLLLVAALMAFFTSSLAVIMAILPMGLLLATNMGQAGLIIGFAIALCNSAKFTDISPLSSSGALMVAANTAIDPENPGLFNKLFRYAGALIVIGPVVTWLLFVVLRIGG